LTDSVVLFVPVLIVTFRNVQDVLSCVHAVARLRTAVPPAVFVCENGGKDAFRSLIDLLTGPGGGCVEDGTATQITDARFTDTVTLRAVCDGTAASITIHAGCAEDNLGYAGGVNAWLRPLSMIAGWRGAWILNPDTEPEPAALQELILFAEQNGKGMVGSRLTTRSRPDLVHCRGLAWNSVRAATRSVDMFLPTAVCLPPAEQDSRLDSPSGASIYITRTCLDRIGLMDERYFLYFEDLDWGLRAKKSCGVGYAHRSIVLHTGGTTIGTATSRRNQSPLAVYLDFRNRLLFVRQHFAVWMPWTVLVALADLGLYLGTGRRQTMVAAIRGLYAGLLGRTGRPDAMIRAHLAAASKRDHEAAS
jgi:N-acetylglucosaminyl-diphospho-decaprenol L-rhamnosyltransferase